jgi:O-antigen/teichoic acid export membrane protein
MKLSFMSQDTAETATPQASHGSRRVIARNFLSLSAASFAQRFIGLFTSIYTRRVLEVVAIGQISWCQSVMSYFSLAINPGLDTIARRDVARDPSKAGRYISQLLMLQVVLALVAFAFAGVFALLDLRGPQIRLILTLQAFGLFLLPFNLTWLLQAHERMAPAAFVTVASQLLQVPALFLFIRGPSHVIRYVWLGYPFSLGMLVYLIWYASHHRLFRWEEIRPTLHGSVALVKEAIPLGLTQAAVLLYYNFGAILLGFARGDAVVGLYTTACNLMMVPTALAMSLATAYFPALSRAQGNVGEMQRTSAELLRVQVWMGFPIAAMGWAGGRYVVPLMYGQHFAASGPMLEWLSLNIALVFFNIGVGWPLIAWGRQKENFYATAVGAVLNVGLNWALIPRYGVWPAIATTIFAELAVMVYLLYWRRRICPISALKIASKPLMASVIVGVSTKVLIGVFPNYWCIVVGLGTTALMASVWVAEKETIRRLWGRSSIGKKAP